MEKARERIEAPIFEIQRFSIHDGPGIRSLVFFKGCPLSCAWCQNPESQDAAPLTAFYQNRCQGCLICRVVCPENAILSEGFRIDYAKCVVCGQCAAACPYEALKIIGEKMTPEELVSRLLVDLPYYKRSGGGASFSGGEPALYPAFLDRSLDLCRQKNIHSVLETCGSFSFKIWEKILRKSDLIYFDLKIINSSDHKRTTGVDSAAIVKNGRRLVENNFPVEFRTPLVQGYTDGDRNIDDLIRYLKDLGQKKIHLLKYHNMGEAKIDVIQGSQKKLGLPTYPDRRHKEIKDRFAKEGFEILGAD